MSEIEQATPQNIFIAAYWRQRNADETNIGYGLRKDILVLQIAASLFTLLGRIIRWFVAPKVRPVMKPWMPFALLLVPTISIGILINRGRKSTGFYQLDNEGRPVLFLSPTPPESLQGRIGVSRQKFLGM